MKAVYSENVVDDLIDRYVDYVWGDSASTDDGVNARFWMVMDMEIAQIRDQEIRVTKWLKRP